MTTTYIEVTLKQMLQMALGVPKITELNLAILHSFFDIILKKIGCQNDKVEIGGLDAADLQTILCCSRRSLLPFNDENVEQLSGQLVKAKEMEKRIAFLSLQLDKHLRKIRALRNECDSKYQPHLWERYCNAGEDICVFPEAGREIECKLATSSYFIDRLIQTFSPPLVERISILKKKIQHIYVDMLTLKENLSKDYEIQMSDITTLVLRIEQLHFDVDEEVNKINSTLGELENMLIAKVNKVHLLALKRFMVMKTDNVQEICKNLGKKADCDGNASEWLSDRCFSCKGELEHKPKQVQRFTEKGLPCCNASKIKRNEIVTCSKVGPCLTAAQESKLVKQMGLKEMLLAQKEEEKRKLCRAHDSRFKVFQGSDGMYYNAGQ